MQWDINLNFFKCHMQMLMIMRQLKVVVDNEARKVDLLSP